MAAEEHGNSLGDAYRRWRCSLLGQITERREAGWLGRRTTAGAAFIAIKAKKPRSKRNTTRGSILPRSHSICPDVLRVSQEQR